MTLSQIPSVIILVGQLREAVDKARVLDRRAMKIEKRVKEGNPERLQNQIDKAQRDILALSEALHAVSPFLDVASELAAGRQD